MCRTSLDTQAASICMSHLRKASHRYLSKPSQLLSWLHALVMRPFPRGCSFAGSLGERRLTTIQLLQHTYLSKVLFMNIFL